MAHFPDYMDKDEARICNKLLTRILKAGHSVRVYDGEEFATDWTHDRAEIQRQTAATGTTNYVVGTMNLQTRKVERIGEFFLVHGNGEDVVSDVIGRNEEQLDYLEKLSNGIE